MSKELNPYLQLAKDEALTQRWKFIYRETEPKHFNTPGGVYDPSLDQRTRNKGSQFQGPADNFLNQVALKLFQQHNWTIPTIPTFSALEPLKQLHKNGIDCTHYCYDPMRFLVAWEGLYNALVSINDNND